MSDIQCYLLGENALVVELTAHSKSDNKEAQSPLLCNNGWLTAVTLLISFQQSGPLPLI